MGSKRQTKLQPFFKINLYLRIKLLKDNTNQPIRNGSYKFLEPN